MDREGSIITCTCFGDTAEKYSKVIEVGKTYYISNGKIQLAKEDYNRVKAHYCIILEKYTDIKLTNCQNSIKEPQIRYNNIADLESMEEKTYVKLMAILLKVGDISEIYSKVGVISKRSIIIGDETMKCLEITLWRDQINSPLFIQYNILKIEGYTSIYQNGITLKAIEGFEKPKECPRLAELTMFLKDNKNIGLEKFQSISPNFGSNEKYYCLMEVNAYFFTTKLEKEIYFNIFGRVIKLFDKELTYIACSTCKKKLIVESNSQYCEKCGKNDEHPSLKFKAPIRIEDIANSIFVSAFDQAGVLLGLTPEQAAEMKDNDPYGLEALIKKVSSRRYIFRLKANFDMNMNPPRINYKLLKILPEDSVKECNFMLSKISQLLPFMEKIKP